MSDKPKLPKPPGFRDELVASLQQPRSPIEEAGAKLALAMRHRHECHRYVAQMKKLVYEAEAELHAADIALADARTHLAELVEGSP